MPTTTDYSPLLLSLFYSGKDCRIQQQQRPPTTVHYRFAAATEICLPYFEASPVPLGVPVNCYVLLNYSTLSPDGCQ